MKPEFPYTRLPGSRRGVLLSASLWMGTDHLLLVRNTRFAETYKRFFYKDVQAILIRKGSRFSVPVYWFIAVILFCISAIFERIIPRWHRSWLSLSAVGALLLWLLVESLFRSCTTHVKTAVSSEELTSLFRRQSTGRAMALLTAKIEEAQGVLNPDLIPSSAPAPNSVDALPQTFHQATPEPTRLALGLCLLSFLLLLGDAAFTYLLGSGELSRPNQIATAVYIVVETAIMLAALVTLWPATGARGLRNLLVAGLVFAGLTYYFSTLGVQFSTAFTRTPQLNAAGFFRTYRAVLNAVNEIGNIALGAAGLITLSRSFRP